MTVTRVEDNELLYRAVRANGDEYCVADGVLRITANAFNDRTSKPSVDRSSVRPDPRDTRLSPTDAVTSLVTEDVREIGPIKIAAPSGPVSYSVDVHHRPIDGSETEAANPAHCQIECDPEIKSTHYKRVKEALALLATKRGWSVPPNSD